MSNQCEHAKSKAGIYAATVTSIRRLLADHFLLTLRSQVFPTACPGQFVQIQCGSPAGIPEQDCRFDPTRVPIVRRPFSLGGWRENNGASEIEILFRVLGPGTAWMSQRRENDEVSVLGPLGKPFSIVRDTDLSLLVGGGTGLPPMMWLARELSKAGLKTTAICGARSESLLPMTICDRKTMPASVAEFGSTPVVITTDDGSLGIHGTVLKGIEEAVRLGGQPRRVVMYSCGPEGMLRAISELAKAKGYECQVCMERMMACGMGTCQSCVVKTKDEQTERGWRYQLCCTDGPVFDSRVILWK